MYLLEIFLIIHILLFLSAWLVKGSWLNENASLKLKLSRFLLLSCLITPILVQFLAPVSEIHAPVFHVIQDYASQSFTLLAESEVPESSTTVIPQSSTIDIFPILLALAALMVAYRVIRFSRDFSKLKTVINSAIPYRKAGRLVIKVSSLCHIPFSARFLTKAYIVLPLSMLSSSNHMKIAIAHEGQHHRNGDCLFAWLMEYIRIVFFGNPGIAIWNRTLSELQEFSCDETLVGRQKFSAHEYGRCLFKVVQTISQYSNSPNLACTVGMALSDKENLLIKRRILMLSQYHSRPSRQVCKSMLFIGAALLVPICTAYATKGAFSSPYKQEVDTSNINPKLQTLALKEAKEAIGKYQAKSAVISIMDTHTGKIVAFAEAGNQAGQSWKSRVFSPASTIKPFIAAAAIDAGISSADKSYICPGSYKIDGSEINNHDGKSGNWSLTQALSQSVNTCFIKVAQDTGADRLRNTLSDFGFDMNSWRESGNTKLATAALGFNIPVTAATLTNSYAILANKGHTYKQNTGAVITEKTANTVTTMLEKVVSEGTGTRAIISGISVAGKTGTLNADEKLALFGGYLPAENPQFAIVVIIENGAITRNGKIYETGGDVAAPVFQKIAADALKLGNKG